MPRKRRAQEREIMPDQRYSSELATKFINCLLKRGKKSIAVAIFYQALDTIAEKIKDAEPINVFTQAVENVKPLLEVRSRRVGGANYQVPTEVRPIRRQSLAIRWILDSAKSRNEKTMAQRLANEFMDAYNKVGIAIKKREDTHKMAEANRAFAHYRW
jgi:small subunit ribosomal protein S7